MHIIFLSHFLGVSVIIGAFSLLAGILVAVYFRGYVEGIVRSVSEFEIDRIKQLLINNIL